MRTQAEGDAILQDSKKDEIDFAKILTPLWQKRNWILAGAIVAGLVGTTVAFMTVPVYRSECIIAPKTPDNGGSGSVLSQLGALGGIISSSVDAGNTPLDRLELIMRSRDLACSVIQDGNFLPRLFPKRWDAKHHAWKGGRAPDINGAANYLKLSILTVLSNPKQGAMTLGIETYDPALAEDLMEAYLIGLKKSIVEKVRVDADSSRAYLESQMINTGDPMLQAKIQDLIGLQIEKSMLVSSQSFDIMETPLRPTSPIWPRKGVIIFVSFLMGLILTSLGFMVFFGIREYRQFKATQRAD